MQSTFISGLGFGRVAAALALLAILLGALPPAYAYGRSVAAQSVSLEVEGWAAQTHERQPAKLELRTLVRGEPGAVSAAPPGALAAPEQDRPALQRGASAPSRAAPITPSRIAFERPAPTGPPHFG